MLILFSEKPVLRSHLWVHKFEKPTCGLVIQRSIYFDQSNQFYILHIHCKTYYSCKMPFLSRMQVATFQCDASDRPVPISSLWLDWGTWKSITKSNEEAKYGCVVKEVASQFRPSRLQSLSRFENHLKWLAQLVEWWYRHFQLLHPNLKEFIYFDCISFKKPSVELSRQSLNNCIANFNLRVCTDSILLYSHSFMLDSAVLRRTHNLFIWLGKHKPPVAFIQRKYSQINQSEQKRSTRMHFNRNKLEVSSCRCVLL